MLPWGLYYSFTLMSRFPDFRYHHQLLSLRSNSFNFLRLVCPLCYSWTSFPVASIYYRILVFTSSSFSPIFLWIENLLSCADFGCDNLCEGALLAALLQFAPTAVSEHRSDLCFLTYIVSAQSWDSPIHYFFTRCLILWKKLIEINVKLYSLLAWWARPEAKEGLKDIRINAVLDFNFSKSFNYSFVRISGRNASP